MKLLRTLCGVLILAALAGCQTVYRGGTMGAVSSYSAEEAGRHWVRPREITYEIGPIQPFTVELDPRTEAVADTLVMGYPQPGQVANRLVSIAAARMAADLGSDGVLVTTYRITETPRSKGVTVELQARPLTMIDLGIIPEARADRERYTVVVTMDPSSGVTTTHTTPVDMRAGVVAPTVAPIVRLSKGAWIVIDVTALVLTAIPAGFLLAEGELGPGIPLAVVSVSALGKLIFDIVR